LAIGTAGVLGVRLPVEWLTLPLSWVVAIVAGFRSAYAVWLSEHDARLAAEAKTKERITVTGLRRNSVDHKLYAKKISISLEIKNDSTENCSNCVVKVEGIRALDGTEPYAAHLPRALRTIRNKERGGIGRFNLRPREVKVIFVCSRTSNKQSEIDIAYEDDNIEPHWGYSLRDTRNCVLSIGIYGPSQPTIIALMLTVDDDGLLHAEIEKPLEPISASASEISAPRERLWGRHLGSRR
jgi:hypothetical protein